VHILTDEAQKHDGSNGVKIAEDKEDQSKDNEDDLIA